MDTDGKEGCWVIRKEEGDFNLYGGTSVWMVHWLYICTESKIFNVEVLVYPNIFLLKLKSKIIAETCFNFLQQIQKKH